MKLIIKKGTTSKRVGIFVQSSAVTDGSGLTGLVFNSASLAWYYWREDEGNANATAVTLVTATRGTFASGGLIAKDGTNMPGFYEIGIPNAALATGAGWVVMVLRGAANMAPVTIEIQLVDYDPNDGVRLGLTALPNAAAEAAGGLYTRGTGAGQIAQTNNGRVDTDVKSAGANAINAASLADDVAVELQNGLATAAALATAQTDLDTIEAVTADILVDTGTTLQAELDGIQTDTENIQTRLPAALVGGRMDSDVAVIQPNIVNASALAADAATEIATAVWAAVLETGFDASKAVRIIAAAVAGKVSGGPGSPVFRNLADTQDQITGTATAVGNRTAATYGS